jgi:hypothetical protein
VRSPTSTCGQVGAAKTIDFWPMLRGELNGPLRDRALFEHVRLDAEIGTLVWPNGADFDPATLHDWDKVGEAMIRMAQSWSERVLQEEDAGEAEKLDAVRLALRRGDLQTASTLARVFELIPVVA